MNTQPVYTAEDVCRLLHINRWTLDALENADDPLPRFSIDGGPFLYPSSALDAWATRQVERQAADRAEID